jgi:hypothetical protein
VGCSAIGVEVVVVVVVIVIVCNTGNYANFSIQNETSEVKQ